MNENALNDLTQKIKNLARDFEFEQASNGVTIALDVRVQDNEIRVRSMASGGPVTSRAPWTIGNGDREMYMPSNRPVIGPGDSVQVGFRAEEDADFNKTLREMYEAGDVNTSVYPSNPLTGVVETGRTSDADDLPRLNEHTADTNLTATEHDILSGSDAPTPSPDMPVTGTAYPDAPGMVFRDEGERQAWLRRQRRG